MALSKSSPLAIIHRPLVDFGHVFCPAGNSPALRPLWEAMPEWPWGMKIEAGGADMDADLGTYALVLFSATEARVQIGRLGQLQLRRGFYVYIGSALGPGGVRARVTHHHQPSAHPHWHIDYLKGRARLERIWYAYDTSHREHVWARLVLRMPGASMPMLGFGSSDCDCDAHLAFFERRPSRREFERWLRALDPAHPSIQSIRPGKREVRT